MGDDLVSLDQVARASKKGGLIMKVTHNSTPVQMDAYLKQIQQQRQSQNDTKSSGAAPAATSDKVQLSAQARQVQQAAKISEGAAGDVREEKVRQVKMDLERGTYQVNSGQVATDMLKETFANNMILKQIDTMA
jgi:negative regulator of flagellin synthesis FlgM